MKELLIATALAFGIAYFLRPSPPVEVMRSEPEVMRSAIARRVEAPVPSVKPLPYPARTVSSSEEPKAEEASTLADARQAVERWEERKRAFFVDDIKVPEPIAERIEALKQNALRVENALIHQPPGNSDTELKIQKALRENRLSYEAEIRALIGEDKWQTLMALYREQFELENSTDLYAPLL